MIYHKNTMIPERLEKTKKISRHNMGLWLLRPEQQTTSKNGQIWTTKILKRKGGQTMIRNGWIWLWLWLNMIMMMMIILNIFILGSYISIYKIERSNNILHRTQNNIKRWGKLYIFDVFKYINNKIRTDWSLFQLCIKMYKKLCFSVISQMLETFWPINCSSSKNKCQLNRASGMFLALQLQRMNLIVYYKDYQNKLIEIL